MFAKLTIYVAFVFAASVLFLNCGGGESSSESASADSPESIVEEEEAPLDPMNNIGVGPIKNIELGALDQEMADKGKEVYTTMCTACHKPEERFIGPAPKGILSRRSPEWIMNMILAPEIMVVEDTVAKALLAEFNGAPMANQNLTEEQARQVLEYFRTLE